MKIVNSAIVAVNSSFCFPLLDMPEVRRTEVCKDLGIPFGDQKAKKRLKD